MKRSLMPMDWKELMQKMAILQKAIYGFNATPIKILMPFFTEVGKRILSYIWRHRRTQIAKEILNNTNVTGDSAIPDFMLYCRAIGIERVRGGHRAGTVSQSSRAPRGKSTELQPQGFVFV